LSNPFQDLKRPTPKEVEWEDWGGQFSCSTYVEGPTGRMVPCDGWATVAKFFPKEHILAWECQHGHRSHIEDVYE
jgi:hypothetical protein